MGVFKIELKQKDKVCFSKDRNNQNIFYTFDYIPGSVLWGFFIGRYSRLNGDNLNNLFNGNIRFLNSYIKNRTEHSSFLSIPMPLSIMTCKKDPYAFNDGIKEGHVIEDILYSDKLKCGENNCKSPLRKVSGNYYSSSNDFWFSPKKSIEMHNKIEKSSQNTKDDSLFSYELLDEVNSEYHGYIITDKLSDDNKIVNFINEFNGKDISLGKAKTSGYGVFSFEITKMEKYFEEEKNIYFSNEHNLSNWISLYLYSDAIIMNEKNIYKTIIEPEDLGLGDELILKRAFVESMEIQGYNAKHNREKIIDLAIKKGSSFFYSIKDGADKNKIRNRLKIIEKKGLGSRKPEGFGVALFQRKQIYDNYMEDYKNG